MRILAGTNEGVFMVNSGAVRELVRIGKRTSASPIPGALAGER